MGRKKKVDKLAEEMEAEKSNFEFDIAGDAKRSVAAVFLFASALVILLGFFGKAGVVGESLNSSVGLSIGWAKWIFPIFLAIAGVVLLLRKETAFYVTKIIGLIITLVSLTGLFHWFFDVKKMSEVASIGSGGGYIGYCIAYFATNFLGVAGGLVMIIALFIIGIIVAFNFSIIKLIEKLLAKSEVVDESGYKEKTDEVEEDGIIGGDEEVVETKQEKKNKEDENIGKIEFVEGPDRYVDEKLFDKLSDGVAKVKKSLTRKKKEDADDDWQLPPMDLLEKNSSIAKGGDIEKNAEIIEKTLHQFGIEVERGAIQTGPAVTQFSFRPAVGVKISRIMALQDDLALALAKHPIRIEAPIPGKSLIGIEVPNKDSAIVRMRNVLESEQFRNRKNNLMIALGEDVSGQYIFGDLAKMPHLLVAGATGTGKSVGINSIITALLYQNSPKDLKMIMVDPKRVELSLYNGIPHLLSEVIVENGKVINALKWAVGEMERRYRQLQDTGSRDIISYNEKAVSEKTRKITDPETGEIFEQEMDKLPYIVIVIDELADLMGTHGKEVEGAIIRLAQMARAVGIHLILSTQKPIVTVITSLIKSNISTRIAFRVPSLMDSRTILDASGAEKLLGNGDMLYLSANSPKPKRIQGVFISESEVKKVVKFVKDQKIETAEQEIGEDITRTAIQGETNLDFKNSDDNNGAQDDDLYEAAKSEVEKAGKASASLLQRRLRVGYARAARLLDILEDKGIVGPSDGAKPREVYTAENKPQYDDTMTDQGERDKWQL
ncbi:MAG: translocase FtsK protein [Candidatus Moranbacteria bacterium GW2011_GWA2_39_41]|nr:MAG: translocase FtsK protein [Candidatus Moranbacteria bacterium GW2011_GWA2_39_41]